MKILRNLFHVLCSGLCALAILTVLCYGYSYSSPHIPNPAQTTDYIYPAHASWLNMREGISWGRMDANGFNNMAAVDNPDILLVGSSQVEGTNVMQSQTIGSLLQENLGSHMSVYNKGISGHFFNKVCQYLPQNLEFYDCPPKYVIIETASLEITSETVDQVINHTVPFTPSHTEGIIAFLMKNPYLRSCYHQITNGWLNLLMSSGTDASQPVHDSLPNAVSEQPYQELFSYLGSLQQAYGTRFVIFNHPKGILQSDGSVVFSEDIHLDLFQKNCEENNIVFVNMADSFYDLYNISHRLPHGFSTGCLAEGHLNAYGNKAIADKLASVIFAMEEELPLCQ